MKEDSLSQKEGLERLVKELESVKSNKRKKARPLGEIPSLSLVSSSDELDGEDEEEKETDGPEDVQILWERR